MGFSSVGVSESLALVSTSQVPAVTEGHPQSASCLIQFKKEKWDLALALTLQNKSPDTREAKVLQLWTPVPSIESVSL